MDAYLVLLLQTVVITVCYANGSKDDCFFIGKKWIQNDVIAEFVLDQSPGHCSGYVCVESKIKFIPLFKCLKTKSIVKRTVSGITSCHVNGKFYRAGDIVANGEDLKGCKFAKICMEDGSQFTRYEPSCKKTTMIPITTGSPRIHCFYNSQFYSPGTTIGEGRSENWCFKIVCDLEGNIIHGDNFDCTTSTTKTTVPTTTTPTTTTIPPGCLYNGQYFNRGVTVEAGQSGNWCYSTVCDLKGNIVHHDNFDCTTSTTKTTVPTTTIPPGCLYNGQYYRLGETIEAGQSGNWCYSTVCDLEGNVLSWDNFDCSTTTEPTTTPVEPI